MIIRDELAQEAAKKLGITSFSPAVQEEILARVGENIMKRIAIEVFKILPEEKRPEFEQFIGSGNVDGLNEFLKPYIPNLDTLIQQETEKEIEETKQAMAAASA